MSTKALIGLKNAETGAVDFVMANFDGYLAHTGMLLLHFWNTPEKIGSLLDEGKISSLGSVIGERHDGTKFPPEEGKGDFTVFYHRDRNQPREETRAEHVDTAEDFANAHENVEYRYLFDNGQWLVKRSRHNKTDAEFLPLSGVIGDAHATVEILSNDENGYILNVDLSEDEDPAPSTTGTTTPTVREISDFLDGSAGPDGWEWLLRKEDDLRLRVKVDAAVVALRLRYNIEDHEDRAEAEA